jgi:hypothetical protein
MSSYFPFHKRTEVPGKNGENLLAIFGGIKDAVSGQCLFRHTSGKEVMPCLVELNLTSAVIRKLALKSFDVCTWTYSILHFCKSMKVKSY